jgi:hypothetical protein
MLNTILEGTLVEVSINEQHTLIIAGSVSNPHLEFVRKARSPGSLSRRFLKNLACSR